MTHYLNFMLIAFIGAFTPGPNNSMLMQSGIYFGFKRTLRHIQGIVFGFNLLFLSINLGIYALIENFPVISIAIRCIGTIYFSYLVFRMITLSPPTVDKTDEVTQTQPGKQIKPLGFTGALFFQWINIKGWLFALSAVGALPVDRSIQSVLIAQLIVVFITISSAMVWTLGGVFISGLLKKPIHFRMINIILSMFLVYIIIYQWM